MHSGVSISNCLMPCCRNNIFVKRYDISNIAQGTPPPLSQAEQPSSSVLRQCPYLCHILTTMGPNFSKRMWMGSFDHWCAKPSQLFGSWWLDQHLLSLKLGAITYKHCSDIFIMIMINIFFGAIIQNTVLISYDIIMFLEIL